MFKVCILGNGAAMPMLNRHLSSQVILHDSGLFLVDCGEGTQFQLQRNKIKLRNLKAIFISHLHGDHVLGLPGLLSSLSLLERTDVIHLFAPKGLKEWVETFFNSSGTQLKFPIEWTVLEEIRDKKLIFSTDRLNIFAYPLMHRIECNGFIFEEKNKNRKLIIEKLKTQPLPKEYYSMLKKWQDVEFEGQVYKFTDYTLPPDPPLSYAYASDTIFDESLIQYWKGVTVLYHESTFLESESHKATQTYHSTAKQAAKQALNAGVQYLLLGHFSARYFDIKEFESEARFIFKNSIVTNEGKMYNLAEMDNHLENVHSHDGLS